MRTPSSRFRGALFLETRVPGTCTRAGFPLAIPFVPGAPFHARSRVNVRVKSAGERERRRRRDMEERQKKKQWCDARRGGRGSGTVCHRGFLSVPKIPADSGKDKEKNGR